MTVDFSQIHRADEIEEFEQILAEDRASEEIIAMVEMVEAHDEIGEYEELVELARLTADQNPISETAEYVKEQLMVALKEVA